VCLRAKGHGGELKCEVGLPSRGRRGLAFFNQVNPLRPLYSTLQARLLDYSLLLLLLQPLCYIAPPTCKLQACFSAFMWWSTSLQLLSD
jgi:hypothetical protein